MMPSMTLACGAMLHLLLLLCRPAFVECQSDDSSDSTCSTFSADVLGSAGNHTFQDTFNCSDGAYVTGVNITYDWWINALQIFCSTGNASNWYGDESFEGINQTFVDTEGGLTSMSSQFELYNAHSFPCSLTFLAYNDEVEASSSESEIGPYGTCESSSQESQTSFTISQTFVIPYFSSIVAQSDTVSGEFNGMSDCGLNAYAIGFLVHYDDQYIYGLGLTCRTITASCPAPNGLSVPYILTITPAPSMLLPAPAPSMPLPTPAPSTLRPTPAPSTLLHTPAPSTLRPTPAPSTLLPTPAPSTLLPTPAPSTLLSTPVPSTLRPTLTPVQESQAPVESTVELGGDCSEYGCVEGLCCSENRTCGAIASFCRSGLCCRTQDDSDCTEGAIQCAIEEETEVQWYDTPIFIGTSIAVGLFVTVGGASYVVYRHFRGRKSRASPLPRRRVLI